MIPLANFAPETKIPDLLRTAPHVRPVLDRYGLRGCGGPLGPRESLGFFAEAHDVPIERLLAELREAAAAPAGAGPSDDLDAGRWSADGIYRPFFLAGIGVVLTLGAVWGAYLLARIAVAGKFTAVGLHEVNAHGHAQIFGWVGLFVMGFAYQAFPRFKHTTLRYPGIAWLSFALMLGGLTVRSALEPIADGLDYVGWAAVGASAVEVVAAGIFTFVIAATWRSSGKGLAVYDGYIAAALFWFVIQAVCEATYLAATLHTEPGEIVPLVATWQGALRDLQIHGFATLMVLGVSQRMLPHMFGYPTPSRRLSLVCLVGLNLGVLGEASGLVLMRLSSPAWAGLWYASVILIAGCVVALVRDWRLFGRYGEADRSRKFVRAAYTWLLVSLGMLIALPVYQFAVLPLVHPDAAAVRSGFSHAYYGATRHAITVGFLSLMIVGVAAKVVPILRGAEPNTLPRLWVPFVLINLGCALRVIGQTTTDVTDAAFPLTGLSGALEVTGLAVWGIHLARLMLARPGWEAMKHEAWPRKVGPEDYVADILDRQPDLLPVFLEFGFRPLANPILRRTVARGVTIGTACRLVGVDQGNFLAAVNARVPLPHPAIPLSVLDSGNASNRTAHPYTEDRNGIIQATGVT
jgi:hypothetical protein